MLISPNNSLPHAAFGHRVEGRQLHRVCEQRPHLRQNPLVGDKPALLPVNAVLIHL